MKNRITLATTLAAVLLLSFSFCTACGNTPKQPDGQNASETSEETAEGASEETKSFFSYMPLKEGDTAPDFTASLADDSEFTLSEQKGKVVLLNFWATWCGPCVREMPAFEKLHGEYGEDIAILAVNSMEAEDIVDSFIGENGYTFPIAYDTEGTVGAMYPTQGIPYTLVIDADGIIRNIYVGAADADTQYLEYKSAVDALMDVAE